MIAALIVLTWLAVLLAIVSAVAWCTRRHNAPVRDTELPTTEPAGRFEHLATSAEPGASPPTEPGSVVWLRPEWVNTIPTMTMPLDESPVSQPPKGG